jgi:transposase
MSTTQDYLDRITDLEQLVKLQSQVYFDGIDYPAQIEYLSNKIAQLEHTNNALLLQNKVLAEHCLPISELKRGIELLEWNNNLLTKAKNEAESKLIHLSNLLSVLNPTAKDLAIANDLIALNNSFNGKKPSKPKPPEMPKLRYSR